MPDDEPSRLLHGVEDMSVQLDTKLRIVGIECLESLNAKLRPDDLGMEREIRISDVLVGGTVDSRLESL